MTKPAYISSKTRLFIVSRDIELTFFEKYIKFLANYFFFQKMKHLIYYFESFVRGTNAISWFLGLC